MTRMNNMGDLPPDPFVPEGIASAMKGMYEMYASAKNAGFSDQQAMHIVITMLTSMLKAPPS
jgi:hypothetical protein